ncbi:NADPH-dependent F420 reductase [Streptococcus ruminantium]|uniref:NADPH-dependent F420 reductase n=1 Tax=Streptococcus ruminantium TaxID=1917441 RepID=UPI0012DBF7EA|nr:diguanylate cyclase [Streptococcus ruminantium]
MMPATISIIGQGKMGQALARHFAKAGLSVQALGRGQEIVQGKFVIFAVPYEDMISLIYPNQDHFANKIIIDISNPLDYQTKTSLLGIDESASLKLSNLFPHLTIIKAFNTNFTSRRLLSSERPLVLMAGNNQSSKNELAKLLEEAYFNTVDIGDLGRSRDLEAFARVQLALLEGGHVDPLQSFAL